MQMLNDMSKIQKRRQRLHNEFCQIQAVFSTGTGTFPRGMTRRKAHFRLHELDDLLREIDNYIKINA